MTHSVKKRKKYKVFGFRCGVRWYAITFRLCKELSSFPLGVVDSSCEIVDETYEQMMEKTLQFVFSPQHGARNARLYII